jgi:ribosomal protein S18 acetylase RimI-like enzyme
MGQLMGGLPEHLFSNPVWHALHTKHRHLGVFGTEACRYPADVAPFAAVAEPARLRQLHSLLEPEESVWVIGEGYPAVAELPVQQVLECLQMVLPPEAPLWTPARSVQLLGNDDAVDMVSLTNVAFPGFYRIRTPAMGSYYGIRRGGALIAMGGERLSLEGYPEISGVCTHPSHRGKGYAASLIWQLAWNHRRDGLVSWLHVTSANQNAIDLYLRLGFEVARKITVSRIVRKE